MGWSLLLNWRIWAVLGYICLAGWGAIQTKRLEWSKAENKAITAEYAGFKAQTKALGEIAKQKAAEQAAKDLQRQKEADDEAKKRFASLDAQYVAYRMRQRAGSGATSSLLPKTSAEPGSGGKVCYSRNTLDSEITAEIGRLYAGIADDTEPYDKAVVVAMLCKTWAAGR